MFKRDEEHGWIDRTSKSYKEMVSLLNRAGQKVQEMEDAYKPGLKGERFYTGNEIMAMFHITRRTLQEYRDKWLLPYTTIGGTILYPESKIEEVLSKNYYKPPE